MIRCVLLVSPGQPRLSLPAKPPLNEANLGGTDYAELSSKYKAIHVKILVWWVAAKCQRCADLKPSAAKLYVRTRYRTFFGEIPSSRNTTVLLCFSFVGIIGLEDRVLQMLATCTFSLQRGIELLDQSGLVMDWGKAREASESILLHSKSFSWLSAHFFEKRVLLFRMRPKSHYIMHQALDLQKTAINLNCFHTFQEEAFLGRIKALALACHGRTMTARVFARYVLCLALLVHKYRPGP